MIMLLAGWSLAGCSWLLLLAGCSWLLLLAGWLLAGWLALHACGRRQYTTRQEDGCPDRA
jgi:hypothetical protein